jgi:hypothetical protein
VYDTKLSSAPNSNVKQLWHVFASSTLCSDIRTQMLRLELVTFGFYDLLKRNLTDGAFHLLWKHGCETKQFQEILQQRLKNAAFCIK